MSTGNADPFTDDAVPKVVPESAHDETKVLQRKLSISEQAALDTNRLLPPAWLTWIEYPFRVADGSGNKVALPEATGWAMDAATRGPLHQFESFIGTAILRLATQAAGCKNPRSCNKTVYGWKPSSVLTLKTVVVGILAAILMPIVGAIIDHTSRRKLLAIVSIGLVISVTFVDIFIQHIDWFALLLLDGVRHFFLLVHAAAALAYLPELTLDHTTLVHYSSRFNLRQFYSEFVFTGFIVVTGLIQGSNTSVYSSVQTAENSAGIVFGISVVLAAYAWTFLFHKRPALTKIPENTTLLTAGVVQVGTTARKIWKDYPSLKWFMISLLWSPEAGAGFVISMVTTFLAIHIGLSGQSIALLNLVLLISNVPGSYFSKWACLRWNPLQSYRYGFVCLAICIAMAVAVLDGPGRKNYAYLFAALWGFAMGWVYPTQRVLFCTLIPKGQETEMMGLFTFCSQIIGWLPPLLFTLLNQSGIDMRWGMSLIVFFIIIALFCTLGMGNYEQAKAEVEKVNSNNVESDDHTDPEMAKESELSQEIAVTNDKSHPEITNESDVGQEVTVKDAAQ